MNRAWLFVLAPLLPACFIHGWADEGGHDRPTGSSYDQIDACAGAPQVQFPAALCVCDTLTMQGNFEAYGFGGAAGATVGVNGRAVFQSNMEIEGTLHAQGGLTTEGNGEISADIISAGSVTWSGNLEVGGDVNVGGNLDGSGILEVEGDLRLGGANRTGGIVEVGGYGPYVTPAEPPCPCDPSTFFDVGSAVAAAANDPAISSLSTALEGNTELRIGTGAYHVRDATWLGNLEVVIDGHVDLFIEDSLSELGNGEIELTTGSTLDVYVAGSLQTLGNTWVGGGVPGAIRIYVGGSDAVLLSAGNTEFVASIYAPSAEVVYQGNTEILGAIFARTLEVQGNFEIAYPGLLDAPEPQRCPPPGSGDGGEPDDDPNRTTDPGDGDDADGGDADGGDADDDGPERDTEPDSGTTGGDEPGTGDGEPGTTGGDEPDPTGGDTCPGVENDCYAFEDKFECIETTGCHWTHNAGSCTWQTCGGLDQTTCGLDSNCRWDECRSACYPS